MAALKELHVSSAITTANLSGSIDTILSADKEAHIKKVRVVCNMPAFGAYTFGRVYFWRKDATPLPYTCLLPVHAGGAMYADFDFGENYITVPAGEKYCFAWAFFGYTPPSAGEAFVFGEVGYVLAP